MVLLPTSEGALTAQWKGPNPIYPEIGMHLSYILKQWNTAAENVHFAAERDKGEIEEENIPEWRDGEPKNGCPVVRVSKSPDTCTRVA